uniref:Uncharacterized protein n=1 Tax=Populus trichocarpa TaxID=3694 RepID=B9ID08_POPTR
MVGGGYVGWWLEKGGSTMEEVVGHGEVRAEMGGSSMVTMEEVVAQKGVAHGGLSLNWRAKEAFVTSDGKQTRIVGVKSRCGLWWAGSLGVVGG